MSAVAETRFERDERERRERQLALFVDRSDEMERFKKVLDTDVKPIMVVKAEAGMGKTSLLMRMVHECALRGLLKAEVVWSDTDVLDYMSVMRKLRDALGVEHFAAFTDLINYYTDDNYQPRLEININLQGNVQVAGGAQISGSTVGDIAGVVLRDNNFTIPRQDIPVPDEVRKERLTERFLQGLESLSAQQQLVLFFNATERMSELTQQWLWGQFLKPVVGKELNVRAVLLGDGKRPPPNVPQLVNYLDHVELKPLGKDDVLAYIGKRTAHDATMTDESRRTLADTVILFKGCVPGDVSAAVDLFLASRSRGV